MPSKPLFPAWADSAFKWALAFIALAVPGVFIIPSIVVRTPYNLNRQNPVEQPVQFDHRHHVQDDDIQCLYCHSLAERSASAGVPPTELCMGCHSQIWNNSPMLEPVRRSYFSGQPIAWNRVNDVPDFVYFNHSVHVRRNISCATCHGRVEEMPLVYRERPFTMGWCLDCHWQSETSRGGVTSIARGHQRHEARARETPDATRLQHVTPDATRLQHVNPLTSCSTCHR